MSRHIRRPKTEADQVVEAIVEHWRRAEVPDIVAMRDELTEHLNDAIAAGKSIDDVTGTDLRAFANEWAASSSSPRARRRIRGLRIAVGVAFGISLAFAAALILQRSSSVTVPFKYFIFTLGIPVVMTQLMPSRLTSRSRPRSLTRQVVFIGVAGGVGLAVAGRSIAKLTGRTSFGVPWWVALAAGAPATLSLVASLVVLQSRGQLRNYLGLGDEAPR